MKRTKYTPITPEENLQKIHDLLIEIIRAQRIGRRGKAKRLDKKLWKLQQLQIKLEKENR